MIRLKNNKTGFTLLEVLFSIAIVGVVLIPIYALQNQVMTRIAKAAQSVRRMFVGFDFFLSAQSALDEKKIEKKSDDPPMQMNFDLEKIPSKSDLTKSFNDIQLAKASFQWNVEGKKQTSELVAIVFTPPEPEPEKDEKEATADKSKDKAGSQQATANQQAGGKK